MMVPADDSDFPRIARLAAPAVNAGMLASLDARDGAPDAMTRANLQRRGGDIASARKTLRARGACENFLAVPPGLRSSGGHALAPLVLIDDFLPQDRMRALHAHACARQSAFVPAPTSMREGPPVLDATRRETLMDQRFTQEREFFTGFVADTLAAIGAALGIPAFTADTSEIKLTNHVDGGFFAPHADNHRPFAEAGRALTWLYYFGETPPRFTGGELYLLDCRPGIERYSPAWFTTIRPEPNRFVAFPSWFHHAVAPTSVPGGAFAHGRFAVSGHVRKAAGGGKAWWE